MVRFAEIGVISLLILIVLMVVVRPLLKQVLAPEHEFRAIPSFMRNGVVVTTAIGQMASHRVQARVSLGSHPISDADLARAIGMALAQIRLPNRRPIHVLPIAWSVDGARGVHDPRSMRGGRRLLSAQSGLRPLCADSRRTFHALFANFV